MPPLQPTVSSKYNNVNLVFNSTKMAKATNMFYKMVWKARKDGLCLTPYGLTLEMAEHNITSLIDNPSLTALDS